MKNQKEPQTKKNIGKSSQVLMEWEAPEYIQHEKSRKWYLTAAGIALGFVVAGILTDNLTMALAILVFAGVYYYMQISQVPRRIKIKITGMGIYAGDMFFAFGRIGAFWIISEPGIKTLNLHIINRYHSDIVIQFDGQDPGPVRDLLIGRIPEWEGKVESFSDVILRMLKF